MIQKNTHAKSVKEIRKAEKAEKEAVLREQCNRLATERFGEDQIVKWSNQFKGIWFLPVQSSDGDESVIEKLAIMKPIDRHILSYASTKIEGEGLYAFLESCMRECFIDGDVEILEDDDYFIPAATSFNKIIEGKKANLLKR